LLGQNKKIYECLIAPKGIQQKSLITARFLVAKQELYEQLRVDVEKLKGEPAEQV